MKTKLRLSIATLLGTALLTTAVASAAPTFRTGNDAEISQDGLHRIDGALMDAAWAQPNIDLGGYTKIMMLPTDVTFKAQPRRSASEFPMTDEQKQGVRDVLSEAFNTALGKSERYALTNEPGRNVLQVQIAVLDVVSHVPPEPAGRGGHVIRDLGEATLAVELRDSMSGEVLARIVDRHTASSTFMHRSNSVTNQREVRLAAERWARLLSKELTNLSSL